MSGDKAKPALLPLPAMQTDEDVENLQAEAEAELEQLADVDSNEESSESDGSESASHLRVDHS